MSLIYLRVRQAAGRRVADVVHLLVDRPLVLALLAESLPGHHYGDGALGDKVVRERAQYDAGATVLVSDAVSESRAVWKRLTP